MPNRNSVIFHFKAFAPMNAPSFVLKKKSKACIPGVRINVFHKSKPFEVMSSIISVRKAKFKKYERQKFICLIVCMYLETLIGYPTNFSVQKAEKKSGALDSTQMAKIRNAKFKDQKRV